MLRQELGRRSFASLLTAERGDGDGEHPRRRSTAQAREYGAQVIDVRIKRADLPDGTPLESAFTRMQTARKQEADDDPRAGPEERADHPRRGRGRGRARSMPTAYGKDPEFYDFYRAMQSYRRDLRGRTKADSTIILSPDNEYLRQFRGQREPRTPAFNRGSAAAA